MCWLGEGFECCFDFGECGFMGIGFCLREMLGKLIKCLVCHKNKKFVLGRNSGENLEKLLN